MIYCTLKDRTRSSARGYLRAILLLCIGSFALSGCKKESAEADPRLDRARAALLPLKQKLKKALTDALQIGPENAVQVCRTQAGAIRQSLLTQGIELGRTSDRLRNPDNAPPSWVKPLLPLAARDAAAPSRAQHLADGRLGYVEPIRMDAICLTCHGKSIAPQVTKVLAQHYPHDRATGYELGEFRGLFWVAVR
jgi:hypothetical protein